MAGNKNSGRKSFKDEIVQANVINLSWKTIYRALRSKKITENEKRAISLEVVKKTCPKEINLKGDGFESNIYTIIGQLQRDFQENRSASLGVDPGSRLHEGRTRPDQPDQEVSEQETRADNM